MIKLSSLTKSFGTEKVLDNIDLEIPKGSCFGLLGSNGAGKSTILRLVSGVYTQDSGGVAADGESVFNNVDIKRRIFFINDETTQYSSYTLKELAKFFFAYYPTHSRALFDRLVKIVELPVDKKLSTFSKGMKRQAIVIIGLACKTDYLLLDEALDGLDPTMRIIVKRMIVDEMLDRGLTTVISSHNLKEVNEMCDMVAVLHKGKILFTRSVDDISGNIHKLRLAFSNEYTRQDFEGLEIMHYERNHSLYNIICKGSAEDILPLIEPKEPLICDIIPLSLEEVFLYEMEVLGYDFNKISCSDEQDAAV